MAKVAREIGRALWLILPLLIVAVFLLLPHEPARGGTYSDPFWTNNSANPECICDSCGCEMPAIWSPEGVNYLTGALRIPLSLFSHPGKVEPNVTSATWYSDLSGVLPTGMTAD